MRVLQAPASKGYAETNGSIVTSALPTETCTGTTVGLTFGNNNEQQQFRIHNTNSNLECSTTTNKTITTAVVSIPLTHQQQQELQELQQQHQQQSHNLRIATTNTTGATLEKFNCDGSLSDSTTGGTALREHQNNFITETSALDVVDSLRIVDSSNNSFFEDCVNGFANLENYRTSTQTTRDAVNESQISSFATSNQNDETSSQKSGQSTPSFEEIHLDNFALERELNRIIRGTSISEACEDDNSCNCKSLQESLKSYDLIRRTSGGGLTRNDRNASPDNDDDDDYDDDQMDSNFHAETIIHSASSKRRSVVEQDDDDDEEEDSLMDDDDEEYLSSQASSCTSHLAHTLSEHYISHQSSDPYDSDLSEYEMELSVDSFECDFLDVGSGNSNNSNNNHNNNNNLKTIMVINNNSADRHLSSPPNGADSDDEENNLSAKPPSGTTGGGGGGGVTTAGVPLISVTQTVSGDTNRNTDDEESNNLQTYLKLYDVTTQQQENERNKSLEIEIPQDEGNFGCPTPDILIKNYNNERYSRRPKPENRPDLLRNVSPNPPMKCRFEAMFQEDEDKLRQDSPERSSPPDTLCTEARSDTGRDDISLGLTPVDIVGDFGEEVEREFGLIVSGYNSRLEYVNYPTGAFYLYNVGERIQPEKMSDALLSNGTEQIATSKYTTIVGHLEPPTDQTHHRMPSETDASTLDSKPSAHYTADGDDDIQARDSAAADAEPDRLTFKQGANDEQLAENNLKTRSSAVATASREPPDSVVHSNRCRDEHSPEKYIPTAIVKPKYQKSSYDERQLPPIGLDFNVKSRAWFDCPSTSASNAVRGVKKSQNTERNSKIFKSAKLSRGSGAISISSNNNNNNNNSSNSAAVNRFGTVTRRSGSSNKAKENCMVAVVPPMMKDPEEMQHDEEHLDNKPVEPHCTRYSIAAWAASLRDSKRAHARQTDEAASAITDAAAACFDVYNIETALPEIDLEAIECHLKRANEEERRRRNDREEIRRRLAMGAEDDYFSKLVTNNVRPGRKPSLQSRLQNGKNLQICFMNEASSDTESHSSDSETCPKLSRMVTRNRNEIPKFFSSLDVPDHPYNANPLSVKCSNNNARKPTRQPDGTVPQTSVDKECDFFTKQARLQIEARMALSQAKDMAHMQMELDRQKQRLSPITGVIRGSLEKVGVVMAPEKRRVSRQMLTDMNIAQLQIIVNDLHTQIEDLNDSLVHYLMERDDLHMGQDSMLVDIEDISRFLSAKELEEDQ